MQVCLWVVFLDLRNWIMLQFMNVVCNWDQRLYDAYNIIFYNYVHSIYITINSTGAILFSVLESNKLYIEIYQHWKIILYHFIFSMKSMKYLKNYYFIIVNFSHTESIQLVWKSNLIHSVKKNQRLDHRIGSIDQSRDTWPETKTRTPIKKLTSKTSTFQIH